MKKVIFSLVLLAGLAACGGGDQKTANESSESAAPAPKSMVNDEHAANPDYQKGSDLVTKYQCMSCHKVDEKLTGPSYRDVANKYAPAADTTVDRLSKKIIAGGQGVWGEIPMTPHPNVSAEDATAMVKYIMLLKK